MSFDDFVELVAQLRAAQKKCNVRKRFNHLERAMELEREVDRAIKAYIQASYESA
jgi:hypothetical protein